MPGDYQGWTVRDLYRWAAKEGMMARTGFMIEQLGESRERSEQ